MLRIVTGFTLAAIGLGLLVLLLIVTGLGNGSNTTRTNVAFAQSAYEGVPYTMENGREVLVDPENSLVIALKDGDVVIQMFPEFAPNHVRRIKALAREGFYDGIVWHRVIDGFMAQTGDPLGRGTGGSGTNLKAEFNGIPYNRGIVGMARSGHPDSADSQFFIMFAPNFGLNGNYTAWGRVVSGMEFVDMIKKGDGARNGAVSEPDSMISVKVLADTL